MRLFLAPGPHDAASIRAVTTAAGYDCPDLPAAEPPPADAVVLLPAGGTCAATRCGALHASLPPGTVILAVEAEANDVEALLDAGASDVLCGPLDASPLTVRLTVLRRRHDAEAALRASEERCRTAFQWLGDVYLQTGPEGAVTLVSPSCLAQTGYGVEELVGQDASKLWADPHEGAHLVARVLRGEDVPDHEALLQRRDGSTVPAFVSASALRGPHGDVVGLRGMLRDITARRQAEDERDRLFLLSIDMLAVIDASARFVRVNPAWTETTGYETEELVGHRAFDYLHDDDLETAQAALEQLRLKQPLRGERLRFRCKNGVYRWFSWAVTPPHPGSDDTYCVVRDVTALVAADEERDFVTEALRSNAAALEEQAAVLDQLRAEAEYAANHDMLTGALNRRAWFAAAVSERSWNLSVFDLDHFKRVNDTWGHPAGDAVLAEFTRRLTEAVGGDALVGRLGGEEFGVLFRGQFHTARAACEAALDAVAGTPFVLPGGQAVTVTVSCGLAPWQPGRHSREESLSLTYDAADRALYRAKASGRARIEVPVPRAA